MKSERGALSDLLEAYKPTKCLRSSSRNLLVIPCSNNLMVIAHFLFLHLHVSCGMTFLRTFSVDLNTFKRNLKTYLFKRYFNE